MINEVKSTFRIDGHGNPSGGMTMGPGIEIDWQEGPIGPAGPNGASVENVMEALIQRIEFLNDASGGRFKCSENERALQDIRNALRWMAIRTQNRAKRGVEGTHRP